MPVSTLERFRSRLALVAYFRHIFGVKDVHDHESVREFYDGLSKQREGYNAEGRSYVSSVLEGRVRGIEARQLMAYDANVRRHTETINQHRGEPIVLKYFQVLAALMTEHYLDRIAHEPEAFLRDLNAFVAEQNRARTGRIDFPSFSLDDLNKLAFWMATGSGKTLLMHLNYYQYLHYYPNVPENVLLVTPNEGLSEQHISEMCKSGIPCKRFDATTSGLFGAQEQTVKVIEITKLVEEKTGSGKSVEVSYLEGPNLVFVDEGHKGAGSEAQTWRNRRAALAEGGFTFEYSATFGQGIGGAGTEIEEEYGKAILFDYSYPHFYEDGYGKDYRILNLEQTLDRSLSNRYMLANLLTFYEQIRCYEANRSVFYNRYNVEPPLLVYIGHTVTAGKTWSGLGNTDRRSLSDVQEQVRFLHSVLTNARNWVPEAIDAILSDRAGLERGDGKSMFSDAFPTLRSSTLDGETIYADMLRSIFHVSAPSNLNLVNLSSAEGEIGLRTSTSNRFFGLINIGDAAHFLRVAQERMPEVPIVDQKFTDSLFRTINQQDSSINILIGAKKFIEGWDSWRVSNMGLMNIGRGEGPQIIQLFGRGVRLLGQDRSLKRSTFIEDAHPENLRLLETLNIFGVRAKYMAQFRDYLAQEGIDVEDRELVVIATEPGAEFKGKGLLVVRREIAASFEESKRFRLEVDSDCLPVVDLMPRVEMLVSEGLSEKVPITEQVQDRRWIEDRYLRLLDWDRLFCKAWQFRTARGYDNLLIELEALKDILRSQQYELCCPATMLEVHTFADVRHLEEIALMILRKYIERFYVRAYRQWEQEHMAYQVLDEEDENLISAFEARVKRSATGFLKTLHEMLGDSSLYNNDIGLPHRVHFDRHLYFPLLVEDQDAVVKYSPSGLNAGERDFVQKLREYVETEGGALLEERDMELFLLRNQTRGRGVGFLVGDGHYFPDFILWLKGDDRQHIVFIEPHGFQHEGSLDKNPKVKLHKQIKKDERILNQREGRDDVTLHAYMVSQTPLKKMEELTGLSSDAAFHERNVYFREETGYPGLILKRVLNIQK